MVATIKIEVIEKVFFLRYKKRLDLFFSFVWVGHHFGKTWYVKG